jgi:predicted ATPase
VRDDSFDSQAPWTSFGPYTCSRQLGIARFRGLPISLDAKGFATLAMLIERAGASVTAVELLAANRSAGVMDAGDLWGVVEGVNHALNACAHDAGHVAHHPSDGFSLVVQADMLSRPQHRAVEPLAWRHQNVRFVGPVFGRDEAIARIAAQVQDRRFVTIVGPGGMGKTTVARAVADDIATRYEDGVCLADLSPLTDGQLVSGAVAAALGVPAFGSMTRLLAHLRSRHMLLILDSCEHVVAATAELVEAIFSEATRVHVLATSREPLRALGEWVYRLGPMLLPARADHITATDAEKSPGVQLFVERARAVQGDFELHDSLAPTVVAICKRLDGIPLAIELAAARVPLLGLQGLAAQVEDRLLLLGGLRRDSPRRHRTIETLLDWSYDLLPAVERTVLRRLAVFRGTFMLSSVSHVAADGQLEPAVASEALLNLVTKSLVTRAENSGVPEYRLLDVTRAYLVAKLAADPEQTATKRRHAVYMRDLLVEADGAWDHMTRQEWRFTYDRWVNDVRAAWDWAFSDEQGEWLGLELTSLSVTLADQTSLMTDFAGRAHRALVVLGRLQRPPRLLAMRFGTVAAYLSVNQNENPHAPLHTSRLLGAIALAQTSGEVKYQAGPLTALWVNEFQLGRYAQAMHWTQRMRDVARASDDPILALIANRTAAQTNHFMGRHGLARQLALDVLANGSMKIPIAYLPSAVDLRVSMRIVLARVLWIQGMSESASIIVEECLQFAQADTPPALCQTLAMAAVPIAMWGGDWALARHRLDQLRDHLATYPFAYWNRWYHAFDAVHGWRTGANDRSIGPTPISATVSSMLDDHLPTLDVFHSSAAALVRVRGGEAGWCAPEVLRVQAESVLRGGSDSGVTEATGLLQEALTTAKAQGALAWELRAAMSLADLWKGQGQPQSAHEVLADVRARFVEHGMGTDLARADALLTELTQLSSLP